MNGQRLRPLASAPFRPGGELIAEPLSGGGFQVWATLPMAAPSASDVVASASDVVSREGAS